MAEKNTQTWLVTGANRGLGLALARAALEAGHRVVASSRHPEQASEALGGPHDRLRTPHLDITDHEAVERVVAEAIQEFGGIDVLVNNAGYGQLGAFETISEAELRRQFETNLFGTMDVTRTVLPQLRQQRQGRVLITSSIAGLKGFPGASAYAATKFALEGWAETLAQEVQPFGITVTLSEPGFFRTDFLDASSASYGSVDVPDYAEFSAETKKGYDESNHAQPGDPAKYAAAVVQLMGQAHPPLRWAAGPDAYEVAREKAKTLSEGAEELKELSSSTGF